MQFVKTKEITSRLVKLKQLANILSMLVTIEVSKLDKFKLEIDVQLSNISFIFSTFSV